MELLRQGKLARDWTADIPVFPADAKGIASRDAGGKVLNAIANRVPFLIGGAADLSPSTKTNLTFDGAGSFEPDNHAGRNMHFGVREHAMRRHHRQRHGAAPPSAVHGHFPRVRRLHANAHPSRRDHGSADHFRLHARLDRRGKEDGLTHQPIEHLATLRAVILGLDTIRPGDANEVAVAWTVALSHTHEPTALVLSRQALPTIDRTRYASADGVAKGAYILADSNPGQPGIILIATGSELPVAGTLSAHEKLVQEGVASRVVSMPSWYLFEQQDSAYRDEVLPPQVKARLAIEQAGSLGWDRYVGAEGATITMSTFGASAPAGQAAGASSASPRTTCSSSRGGILARTGS